MLFNTKSFYYFWSHLISIYTLFIKVLTILLIKKINSSELDMDFEAFLVKKNTKVNKLVNGLCIFLRVESAFNEIVFRLTIFGFWE